MPTAKQRETELLAACASGDLPTVHRLLSPGFFRKPLNANCDGCPLAVAAENGYGEIVSLLIQKGALYSEALIGAAKDGNIALLSILIEGGADVGDGKALHEAAGAGHIDIVSLLIRTGAHGHAGGALREAARAGHAEIVSFLISTGASLECRPYVHWVSYLGSFAGECVGTTPLMLAATNGHIRVAQLLIEGGAAVNALASTDEEFERYRASPKTVDGEPNSLVTALSLALQNGHLEIANLLRIHGAELPPVCRNGRWEPINPWSFSTWCKRR